MNDYEFYKAEIALKKTNASKKAFLTKEIKAMQAHVDDLVKGYKKGPSGSMKFAYLHGDPITPSRISKAKTTLQVCKNLKAQIK